MAIVRRELILLHKQKQRDGMQLVKENCFDSSGRKYVHGPFRTADTAASEVTMNARDWTDHIESRELEDAKFFIQEGGSPADYVPGDLTLPQIRRLMLKAFMKTDARKENGLVCKMAAFIASFTVNQIANVASISTAKATIVRDRAIDLRDNICPALAVDDAKVETI